MIRKLAKINDGDIGVYAISLVEKPANKAQFKNPCKSGLCSLSENNEVVGLVLRPEQDILRAEKNGEKFNMYFDANSVKVAHESFTKNLAVLNSNLQHNDKPQEGVTFTESWLVEDADNDKASLYGFVPKLGEWYVKAKIENKEVLSALKSGAVNGFSLEGEFSLTESEGSKFSSMKFMDKLKALLAEEEKPAEEKMEEKLAMSPEEMEAAIIAIQEAIAELVGAKPAEPTEEEMAAEKKAEEDLAEEEKKKDEEMAQLSKDNTELSEKVTKLSELVAQIPVDLATVREGLKLSEEDKTKGMSLKETIEFNNKNK